MSEPASECGRTRGNGGQLQIRSARVETGVRLSFTNDGETFATADAPYIFERFYRADKSPQPGVAPESAWPS